MKNIYTLILLFITYTLQAQSPLTGPAGSAQNAVQNVLLGPGVEASNFQFQGNVNTQLGTFTNGSAAIGFNSGLILSTGTLNHTNAVGTNVPINGAGTGGTNLFAQAGITNANTFNAAVLTFDFVPLGDTLKFDYVFASNEYNNFVNSTFNDVFAFFLSGPNPDGGTYNNQNIALIPGTNLPVTINNVNNGQSGGCSNGPCNNCQFFIDNCNNQVPLAFGGRTTVLTAVAPVVACSTYTIRLAIADVADGALNSAVFLRAGSFSGGVVTISPQYNFTNAFNDTTLFEGCSELILTFLRDGTSTNDTTFFDISGSAVNGVNFTDQNGNPINNFVVFPPGQDSTTLIILPAQDGVSGPNTTLTITITNQTACGEIIETVSFTIVNVDPLQVDAGPDRIICQGSSINLNAQISGGIPPYQTLWFWNGGAGSNPINNLTPTQTTVYNVLVTDGCQQFPNDTDQVVITVLPPAFDLNFNVQDASCNSANDGSIEMNITGNFAPFNISWSNGSTSNNINNLMPGNYTVTVTDSIGCVKQETIEIKEPINIVLNLPNRIVCPDTDLLLNPNPISGVSYSWEPATGLNATDIPSPIFNVSNNTQQSEVYEITAFADSTGACGFTTFTVTVRPKPIVDFQLNDTTAICIGQSITFNAGTPPPGMPAWSSYLWNTGQNTQTISTDTAGLYYVIVTDVDGCTNRDSVYLEINQPPVFSFIDYEICPGDTVFLVVQPFTGGSVLWNTGDNAIVLPVFASGSYTAVYTNACGSESATSNVLVKAKINANDIPNIITPNNDGVNDILTTDAFEDTERLVVEIYNRWGRLVYATNDKQINWDGGGLIDGVYFITANFIDCAGEETKLNSTITIAR